MRRLLHPLLALALSLCALGCGQAEPENRAMGEACSENEQCRHGHCITQGGPEEAMCTRSCARTEECPRGWSCSGTTSENVVVCVQGAGNPMGIGARQ